MSFRKTRWLLGLAFCILCASGCAQTVRTCPISTEQIDTHAKIASPKKDAADVDADAPRKMPSLQIPICGVLSEKGYATITFLVPDATNQAPVYRFEVVDHDKMMPPLEVEAGWWICVSAGEILSRPSKAHPDEYGKIRIDNYLSDESNGEKGQE